jgi:hypothetical protein
MSNFSDHPRRPITELEAFTGNILGRTGIANRQQRELSTSMKEQFGRDTKFISDCILKDDGVWSEESLERSMACLAVGLEDQPMGRGSKQLLSFKYLAAAICLKEVEKLPV